MPKAVGTLRTPLTPAGADMAAANFDPTDARRSRLRRSAGMAVGRSGSHIGDVGGGL